METIATLREFVEKFPQISEGNLNYAFLGGTAVRLHQYLLKSHLRRPITDFDIVSFVGKCYPVHTCLPQDVFGSLSLTSEEVKSHVKHLNLEDNTPIYFLGANFLTVTKTCSIDLPREKDYEDISFLWNFGLVNPKILETLYLKVPRITRDAPLVVGTLEWLVDEDNPEHRKLFQTFPRMVNLLSEFPSHFHWARNQLLGYARNETGKTGYQMGHVFYGINLLIRQLPSHRKIALENLLRLSRSQDYADFDAMIHNDLIPRITHARKLDVPKIIKEI